MFSWGARKAEVKKTFFADNSVLKANTLGLGYRKSKSLDDKDGDANQEWSSVFEGVDEGDGWVRVDQRFLPVKLGDVIVLREQDPATAKEAARKAADSKAAAAKAAPAKAANAAAAAKPTLAPTKPLYSPAGHELKPAQANPGRCDGCNKEVMRGESVMESRADNWYLCTRCVLDRQERVTTVVAGDNGTSVKGPKCPAGHTLKRWCSQVGGVCDGCSKEVPAGSMVMDCRQCDYYLCESCCPAGKVAEAADSQPLQAAEHPAAASTVKKAASPKSADAKPAAAKPSASKSAPSSPLAAPETEAAAAAEPATANSQGYQGAGTGNCPKGHPLKPWRAHPGNCDCCGKQVQEGEMVMDCRECNWYACTLCSVKTRSSASRVGEPVADNPMAKLRCPADHQLKKWKTTSGGCCDGCGRDVKVGETTMDCRDCNWYLCLGCSLKASKPSGSSTMLCLKGHELRRWASQAGGQCDGCGAAVKAGAMVLDCRVCDWYICEGCISHDVIPPSEGVENVLPEQNTPEPKQAKPASAKPASRAPARSGAQTKAAPATADVCPKGHELRPCKAEPGVCDVCAKHVEAGELVMDCLICNWYMCSQCSIKKEKARVCRSG